ncbi:UNVERIFIED_CONTAM: hypothetical protein FKN15_064722 [Acipenser sinensis]
MYKPRAPKQNSVITPALQRICLMSFQGLALASGLAATMTIAHMLKCGDNIICMNDVYGGTNRYFRRVASEMGLEVSFVDCTKLDCLKAAIKPNTKMDKGCADVVHAHNKDIIVVVDNTFMSAYFQARPRVCFGARRLAHRRLDARCTHLDARRFGASTLGAHTSTLGARRLVPRRLDARCTHLDARRFGARRLAHRRLDARCTHLDARRFGARRLAHRRLDARCTHLDARRFGARRLAHRRLDARCTHLDARRFGARRLAHRRLDARCTHLDARRFGARRLAHRRLDARCTHLDARRFGARRLAHRRLDARCTHLDARRFGARRLAHRRLDARCTHLDARRFGARRFGAWRIDAQCTHLDARRFGASTLCARTSTLRRSTLGASTPRRSVHAPRRFGASTLCARTTTLRRSTLSARTTMSGFHRCVTCQAKLPASIPHADCVSCLGPDHAASALADRACCQLCAGFQTRTLRQRARKAVGGRSPSSGSSHTISAPPSSAFTPPVAAQPPRSPSSQLTAGQRSPARRTRERSRSPSSRGARPRRESRSRSRSPRRRRYSRSPRRGRRHQETSGVAELTSKMSQFMEVMMGQQSLLMTLANVVPRAPELPTGPVAGQPVVPPPVPHGQPQEVWDVDAVSRDASDAEPLFEEGTEPEQSLLMTLANVVPRAPELPTGPVAGQPVVPPPVPHGQPQEVWDVDAVSRDASDAEPLFEEGTEPEVTSQHSEQDDPEVLDTNDPMWSVVERAARHLGVDWPASEPTRRSLFELPSAHTLQSRILPAFPDFIKEVQSTWGAPASTPATSRKAAAFNMHGASEAGLASFPPVGAAFAALVKAPTLSGLAKDPSCPNRQCRITEAHLKKGYAAATEAVRLSNVASLLTVYQAALLRDLPECPSAALRTELGERTEGRSIASLVVARRQLWLSQARVQEPDKVPLLDAPISPGHTFGPAVEEMLQRSVKAREASQQLAKMWPSKPFQPRRPQERQWRRAPPQQQAQSRGSMTAPSGVSARGQPVFARPQREGWRPRGGGKPRPRGSGQAPPIGAVPSPFDCYLCNRGLKTLHLRMKQHFINAVAVAKFLEADPRVDKVVFPGLPSHPQYELMKRQCTGCPGMITFYIKGDLTNATAFLRNLKLFALAESLGGYESLAEHPAIMTHASVPEEERKVLGISDTLIRLSIGIEDVEDIIVDLDQALKAARDCVI